MSKEQHKKEAEEIRRFLADFYEAYYTERDCSRVSAMVSDHVVSVGLSDAEIGRSKQDFTAIIQQQIAEVPDRIPYFVEDTVDTDFGNHIWNCFSKIGLRVTAGNWGVIRYVVRNTITLLKIDGSWKICCIHCSESTEAYGKKSPFLFETSVKEPRGEIETLSQWQIGEVMNHLVPGGVISRIATEDYPIAVANKQFLKMMGYSNFNGYEQAQNSTYLNHIHPDDVEKFIYIARFISATGKQCECDYRLKRCNGEYLWVHDIGRRAISNDGKELLISVITDISEKTERMAQIEKENGIDFLTNIYNRRGFLDRIKERENTYSRWLFCIVDVDYFKNINDLYSHIIGDHVLEYVAQILLNTFGKEGLVARIGGDEFAVFVPNFVSIQQIEQKLTEVSEQYKQYVSNACPQSLSSFSVGGVYGEKNMKMLEQYEKADANLYRVKNTCKGNICITGVD